MKLYAIADLHLSYALNRDELQKLQAHPDDGLILCGDLGETLDHLDLAFKVATAKFAHVFWCPGNHELYSVKEPGTDDDESKSPARGQAKYDACVAVARRYGVRTPEDEYMEWNGEGGPAIIAPTFLLYDYSFRPDHIPREKALEWAAEQDIVATDEYLLHPDPYETRDEWCHARVEATEKRLAEATLPLVIANHWPLREDLIFIPRVPRFTPWCGTKKTADWHTRFKAKVVVSGHLHVPRTDWKDFTRFEECSLGYPQQWESARTNGLDINDLLREILPGPAPPESGNAPMKTRRFG
jgi:predicted phosphodiesterase